MPIFPRLKWAKPGRVLLVLFFLAVAATAAVTIEHFLFVNKNKDRQASAAAPPPEMAGRMMARAMFGRAQTPEAVAFQKAASKSLGRVADSGAFSGDIWLKSKMPVGTPAPDFSLSEIVNRQKIRLSDYRRKKPVVLLFGNFGCDVFCDQLDRVKRLYQTYNERAEFLLLYVPEPEGDLAWKAGHERKLLPAAPVAEDFRGRIRRGLSHFGLAFPCLLATDSDTVQSAYDAFPERLIIVDRVGQVALDAGRGLPHGWDLDQVESWLQAQP
jgi:hypothetical protein